MMTSAEIMRAYNHPAVALLRELLADIYTAEEFGMYLALPNLSFGGKSELQMIHEGGADRVVAFARELVSGAYVSGNTRKNLTAETENENGCGSQQQRD